MPHIILIELGNHVLGLSLLRLGYIVLVYIIKHPFAQALHGLLHTLRHGNGRFVHAVQYDVVNHVVEAFPDTVAQHIGITPGQLMLREHPGPDGVVYIVVDIGYLI